MYVSYNQYFARSLWKQGRIANSADTSKLAIAIC